MRIKRSVTRFFSVLVVPAVSLAVVSYFGAYAIWGNRGVLALEDTQAQLGIQQQQLSQVLKHVEKLEQVDVTGVEPTAHANAVFNVFRDDETRDWFSAAEALSNAPRQANQLFIVPKVIE